MREPNNLQTRDDLLRWLLLRSDHGVWCVRVDDNELRVLPRWMQPFVEKAMTEPTIPNGGAT